ncbi:MAG: hypothetical protein NTV14_03605 [Coprothermobacterota bacterium]|nr:hypothetical protein [Coprothermobacterota bacterium]
MVELEWVLEEVAEDPRFPYRLTVRRGMRLVLALRTQDRWPGSSGHIFCLREEGRTWSTPTGELERVAVVAMERFGKRLSLVLNRPRKKRCDFLFLVKPYKEQDGSYEQIFWRTQEALRQRRPRSKLSTYVSPQLTILADSRERYGWSFPEESSKRKALAVGDYALEVDGELVAVVERKTLPNLLAEFGRMAVFHQQLAELGSYPAPALVIEAAYADLLSPAKVCPYTPTFAAKALAELQAFHPGLPMIFAGSRKLAREWVLRFFQAVRAHLADEPHPAIRQALAVAVGEEGEEEGETTEPAPIARSRRKQKKGEDHA